MTESLNNSLRANPDNPKLLNEIAWILVTNSMDRERALELAKRATKLAPDKLSYMDTMAECYFQLGKYDEAIAIEAELVNKEPNNDQYWKQLRKFKEAKQKGGR